MLEAESRRNNARRRPLLICFWAVIAGLSVGRGFFNSLKAGQSQDLESVYNWISTWLWYGGNPYVLREGLTANYPPHAIVFLSLLALIPNGWLVVLWSIFNVALVPVVGYVAFRVMNPEAPRRTAWLPCLLFLSWAGLRVGLGNGQFSLLMLAFGLLVVSTSARRNLLSGLCLALALMKPHVGGAFFLWAVARRKWKSVIACLVFVLVGVGLFSWRLGIEPIAVSRSYLLVLAHQFGGPSYLPGVVELRPLVHAVIAGNVLAEAMHFVVLLALLGSILVVALGNNNESQATLNKVVLQLCCLWALLGVFHNVYDLILLLPVTMGLWCSASCQHPLGKQSRERFVFWFLQFAMVVELPGVWWKVSQRGKFSTYKLAGSVLLHFDRVLVVAVFIYILSSLFQRRSEGSHC